MRRHHGGGVVFTQIEEDVTYTAPNGAATTVTMRRNDMTGGEQTVRRGSKRYYVLRIFFSNDTTKGGLAKPHPKGTWLIDSQEWGQEGESESSDAGFWELALSREVDIEISSQEYRDDRRS